MAARGAGTGTSKVPGVVTNASFGVSDGRLLPLTRPVPCVYGVQPPQLGIEAELTGGGSLSGGGWSAGFSSFLPSGQAAALEALADARHDAACPPEADGGPQLDAWTSSDVTRRGVLFGYPTPIFHGVFSPQQSRRRIFPVDRLMAGRSFALDSDTQRFSDDGGARTASWSLSFRFARRR